MRWYKICNVTEQRNEMQLDCN